MCNLLKAAVACLPRLSKSNHPLLIHCHWASVIDKQLSQLQGVSTNEQVTKSHLQSNAAFHHQLRDLCYLASYISTLFHTRFVLICSPRWLSTGSFFEVYLPLHLAGRFTSCNLHYSASLNIRRLLLTPVSPICQPQACSPVVYLSADGWLSCAVPL